MKHVNSRIDDGKKASEIIQGVDLLQCMRCVNQAFEKITKDTIKHCLEKCGFSEVSLLAEEPDEEFEDLLKSLTIDVMPESMRHLTTMLIHQKCQSMCKRKARKISYISNA